MVSKIQISYRDINSPAVDEIIGRESAFALNARTFSSEINEVSLIHKSWFNLMIAGFVGAFIAWAVMEPVYNDYNVTVFIDTLLDAMIGGMVGLMVGGMEGILAKNYTRALKGASIGLGIGFFGGIISHFMAIIVLSFILSTGMAITSSHDPSTSFSFFIFLVVARSLCWLVAGMTVGLGPGIAIKSKKLIYNGFLGGMIGGALGGLLFDPIGYLISGGTFDTGGELCRAIGLSIIGLTTGLMIGLVDLLTKDAWLLMTAGPLSGKQFIVYKNPTSIGSSPNCEIYLFKDSSIEPRHAMVHTVRDGYEIEDMGTHSGTWVNGRRISRQALKNGDTIQIGNTKFNYSEKEKTALNV